MTSKERAEEVLGRREERWMRQASWDETGKREIIGILDQLVSGDIFSYVPSRPDSPRCPRTETSELLRQIPPGTPLDVNKVLDESSHGQKSERNRNDQRSDSFRPSCAPRPAKKLFRRFCRLPASKVLAYGYLEPC